MIKTVPSMFLSDVPSIVYPSLYINTSAPGLEIYEHFLIF